MGLQCNTPRARAFLNGDFMRVTQEQVDILNNMVGFPVYKLSKVGNNLTANQLSPDYISVNGLADMFNGPSLSSKAWNLARTELETYYYRYEQDSDLGAKLHKDLSTYKKNGYFTTKETAMEDYQNTHNAAMPILENAAQKLKELQSSLGVYVSFNIDGDTHGTYNEYMYVGCKVDGYYFKMKIGG